MLPCASAPLVPRIRLNRKTPNAPIVPLLLAKPLNLLGGFFITWQKAYNARPLR